jgi:hypothetical protein
VESISNDEQRAAQARTGGYVIGLRTFGADRRVRDTASWWEFWGLTSSAEHTLEVLLDLCCSAHETRVTLGWQSILQKFRQGETEAPGDIRSNGPAGLSKGGREAEFCERCIRPVLQLIGYRELAGFSRLVARAAKVNL